MAETDEISEAVEEAVEEATDELSDDVSEAIEEAVEEAVEEADSGDSGDVDVDVTVHEAPEIPETSYVDVGDLHISGPPDMVERITKGYLADHIDHNPHGESHTPVDTIAETADEIVEEAEETVSDIVPDSVEESIEKGAESDTAPAPDDWLFRQRTGSRN